MKIQLKVTHMQILTVWLTGCCIALAPLIVSKNLVAIKYIHQQLLCGSGLCDSAANLCIQFKSYTVPLQGQGGKADLNNIKGCSLATLQTVAGPTPPAAYSCWQPLQ